MEIDSLQATKKQRVLIFPAQTPKVLDRQVYFLFSLVQMEDVIMDAAVHPVPFSPPYIEGVAEWRDHVVPVLSLEECLGLKPLLKKKQLRWKIIEACSGLYRQSEWPLSPSNVSLYPLDGFEKETWCGASMSGRKDSWW